MRIRFADGAETVLAYCTNVHPGESLPEVTAALGRWCGPVRAALGVPRLTLGLWLARRSSAALAASAAERARLRDALAAAGLEVVTLNGFPYGDFHAGRVKEAVYRPDWRDPRRAGYTLDLARILTALLPPDAAEGTISTLPLAWAPAADGETAAACAAALARLAADLERLAQASGRPVRVCLEPEPGCLVERTEEAIAFFADTLPAAARRAGVPAAALARHLGVCFDACHQAVQFEDPAAAWARLAAAGVRVGKVQLSCALAVPGAARDAAARLLGAFDEPRFLHQVRRRGAAARVEAWPDLAPALAAEGAGDWRVHFHVPLDWQPQGAGLATTAPELARLLAAVAATRPLPHLEVETYTWSVLPAALRPRDDASLVAGLAREVGWAARALAGLGGRPA